MAIQSIAQHKCTQLIFKLPTLYLGNGKFATRLIITFVSDTCTIALISHASKVMLKILQARLQQHVNCQLPDVQAGFKKGEIGRAHV